ncbi:hypothetical protein BDV25DRAFT_23890 [Aspergillus avenaceus]|uniref:C2H2-type domain-containing protein n=1 Tax=Aspergillus avenaceus TaxID=36643 RepID=A0A5N6TPB8_ASPAV|nr:hypothetical protein BDV25DRAFT_23890 [Aspergillus avenaceus]
MSNNEYGWLLNHPPLGAIPPGQGQQLTSQPSFQSAPAAYNPPMTSQPPATYAPRPQHQSPYLQDVRSGAAYPHYLTPYQETNVVSMQPQQQRPFMPSHPTTQPISPVISQGQIPRPHVGGWRHQNGPYRMAQVPRQINRVPDAKRRRIETSTPGTTTPISQPVPQPMSQPVSQAIPQTHNLSSFSFSPRGTSDKTHLKNRADIAKPLNKADAASKITYDPKTIARDVLIATGRHPTEPGLNHHLSRLRDVFYHVDNSSDLETFRWDLVDTERVKTPRDPIRVPARPPVPQAQPPLSGPPITQPVHQLAKPPAPPPVPPVTAPAPPPPEKSPPKQLENTQVQFKATPQPKAEPQPKPKPTPQPQAQPLPKSQPQLPVQTSTPSPSVQTGKMTGKRGPGRPPGSGKARLNQTVPRPVPQIPYQVYACRWDGCHAELHNMEMLARHIYKVHVPFTLACGWQGCSNHANYPAAQLVKHIREAHLQSIAWLLGDGPSVPGTVGSDAGNSPVPLTIPESHTADGEDSLIFPANESTIRAFNRVHGNSTQLDKAQGIFRAVQRLKCQIGVGLDPGGCQLATPARNERVSNEESFYEVKYAT